MEYDAQEKVRKYKTALGDLFAEIESWIAEEGLKAEKSEILISEPHAEDYTVPALTILDAHDIALAEVRPAGAWIIGADGRVDIEGRVERERLMYWEHGAPIIHTPLGKGIERTKPMFRGAEKGGWYWIEEQRLGRARSLDKELLMDLVEAVQPL